MLHRRCFIHDAVSTLNRHCFNNWSFQFCIHAEMLETVSRPDNDGLRPHVPAYPQPLHMFRGRSLSKLYQWSNSVTSNESVNRQTMEFLYLTWTRRKAQFKVHLNRNVRKRTFLHVRATKTQISLRIRAGWLESSLSAWINFASLAI